MTEHALGRLVEHDERSRAFAARVAATKPKTVLWDHHGPVLDQGQLGSCTGNALAQWANTAFAQQNPKGPDGFLTEADAVDLYSRATHLDRIAGYYPPDDTGSSGLAVCKAGVRRGLLTRYDHAFGFDALLLALQHSPVIAGTLWTKGMFDPTSDGRIAPTGPVEGGHEYLLLGANMEQERITMLNSWSEEWSEKGRAWISFADYEKILADQGDIQVPMI